MSICFIKILTFSADDGIVLYLKGSAVITTLENLWYGNIQPYDMELVHGSQHEKAFDRKVRYENALAEMLTEEQKEIYNKLSAAQSEQLSLGECDAFCRGFSLGIKIATEVYGK